MRVQKQQIFAVRLLEFVSPLVLEQLQVAVIFPIVAMAQLRVAVIQQALDIARSLLAQEVDPEIVVLQGWFVPRVNAFPLARLVAQKESILAYLLVRPILQILSQT